MSPASRNDPAHASGRRPQPVEQMRRRAAVLHPLRRQQTILRAALDEPHRRDQHPAVEIVANEMPRTDRAALRTGFLTNALNPKTTVFIVSLFIALAHAGWFSLVAVCFSAQAVRDRLLSLRHWIDRTFGILLVGFGVMLAIGRGSR